MDSLLCTECKKHKAVKLCQACQPARKLCLFCLGSHDVPSHRLDFLCIDCFDAPFSRECGACAGYVCRACWPDHAGACEARCAGRCRAGAHLAPAGSRQACHRGRASTHGGRRMLLAQAAFASPVRVVDQSPLGPPYAFACWRFLVSRASASTPDATTPADASTQAST